MGQRVILRSFLASFLLASAFGDSPEAKAKPIDPALLKKFEARIFKDAAGHALKYRLCRPSGYDSRTHYPLVLFLHGAAGSGDDNTRQFNGGNEVPPLALSCQETQTNYPCFVLVPQCPRTDSWANYGSRPAETVRLTLGAIDSLKGEFSIDPQRLYLVGVSMGGRGVWDVAMRFPRTFAAAVPICAAGDPAGVSAITGLPIWCFHGASDPLVNVNYARAMISALRKAGGHPRYTEYPGVGHDVYKNAFKEPDLLPWLFAQKRSESRLGLLP